MAMQVINRQNLPVRAFLAALRINPVPGPISRNLAYT